MITYESNAPRCIARICDDFNEGLKSFFELGYFYWERQIAAHQARDYNMIPEPTLRYIDRTIARQMKRPYVRASYNEWRDYKRDANGMLIPKPGTAHDYEYNDEVKRTAYLTVPRRKYLSPIINPLMLAAQKREYQYGRWNDDAAVTYWSNTRDFYFTFTNIDLWLEYRHLMATREEMREALKLPPL